MVGNEVKFIIFRIGQVGERESEQSPRHAAAAESFSHVQRAEIRAQILPFVKIVVNHACTAAIRPPSQTTYQRGMPFGLSIYALMLSR